LPPWFWLNTHLDLHRGLTVAAELIWDGPEESNPDAAICLYELSTFEDQDRIVYTIEPDGLPTLSLRFNGQQYGLCVTNAQHRAITRGGTVQK
jgi:hypothetical protein